MMIIGEDMLRSARFNISPRCCFILDSTCYSSNLSTVTKSHCYRVLRVWLNDHSKKFIIENNLENTINMEKSRMKIVSKIFVRIPEKAFSLLVSYSNLNSYSAENVSHRKAGWRAGQILEVIFFLIVIVSIGARNGYLNGNLFRVPSTAVISHLQKKDYVLTWY